MVYLVAGLVGLIAGGLVFFFVPMETNHVKEDMHNAKLEKAIKMTDIPFKVTLETITQAERILFYGGILSGTVLFFRGAGWFAYFVFAVFFFASVYVKKFVYYLEKRHAGYVVRELPIFIDAFISLVRSGSTVEMALIDSIHVSRYVGKHITPVVDSWHNPKGPSRAIGALAQSGILQLELFAGLLMQLVEGGDKTLSMIEGYKRQLTQLNHYHRIQDANKKPIVNTLLLMFPFAAAVISWFYPLMISALRMFEGFLS